MNFSFAYTKSPVAYLFETYILENLTVGKIRQASDFKPVKKIKHYFLRFNLMFPVIETKFHLFFGIHNQFEEDSENIFFSMIAVIEKVICLADSFFFRPFYPIKIKLSICFKFNRPFSASGVKATCIRETMKAWGSNPLRPPFSI